MENEIDPLVVNAVLHKRARITGTGILPQLASTIRELGGPNPRHFARSYIRATGTLPADANALLAATFRQRTTGTRSGCAHCNTGVPVSTFGHDTFTICLKHRRWLAPGQCQDRQRRIPDGGRWVQAERRYRRAMSTGFISRRLAEAVWRIVIDHAATGASPQWTCRLASAHRTSGFVVGVDDRIGCRPGGGVKVGVVPQLRDRVYVAVEDRS